MRASIGRCILTSSPHFTCFPCSSCFFFHLLLIVHISSLLLLFPVLSFLIVHISSLLFLSCPYPLLSLLFAFLFLLLIVIVVLVHDLHQIGSDLVRGGTGRLVVHVAVLGERLVGHLLEQTEVLLALTSEGPLDVDVEVVRGESRVLLAVLLAELFVQPGLDL